MKKTFIAVLIAALMFGACKQDASDILKSTYDTDISQFARLKINYASVKRANPSFQIKINETKVSGLITARYPYPGGGFNTGGLSTGDYLAVPVGTNKIKISIPNVGTSNDSITFYDGSINLPDLGHYTFHVTDTGASMKTALFKEDLNMDPLALPKFKVVNLMPNVPAIDLYFGPTLLASNITYLKSSPEFSIDTSQTNKIWTVRAAGTGATGVAIATYDGANTVNTGRKYTGFAMGYSGLAGTTEPRRPFISFFYTK